MKTLLLAGLIVASTWIWACSPSPRPSARGNRKADEIANNAKGNERSPTPTPSPVPAAPANGNQNQAGSPQSDSGKGSVVVQPVQPVTISTAQDNPLVFVGAFGIRYAIKTLCAVEKQAVLMDGQLKEMQGSGKITTQQVNHLINAERAWIQVPEIQLRQKLSFVTPETNQFHIWMHPYIVNNGRTQARITKIIARAHILDKVEGSDFPRPPRLPDVPDYTPGGMSFERDIVLSPKQGINWFNVPISVEDLERIKAREAFIYIYGRIDYVDFSKNERLTRFCKIYWIPYGPSDPVFHEDFSESAVIPRAYTEYT
jgi:hypothetical protein